MGILNSRQTLFGATSIMNSDVLKMSIEYSIVSGAVCLEYFVINGSLTDQYNYAYRHSIFLAS
jgi:hypothetical protein